jgi:hypothetical protein
MQIKASRIWPPFMATMCGLGRSVGKREYRVV